MSTIIDAMAKAFFASAYADAYDSAVEEGIDPGFSPSGCDWMDLMPDEIDPAAIHAAQTLTADLQRTNGCTIDQLFARLEHIVVRHGGGDREVTEEMFGHYLAMQAMGHGVGLADAFGQAAYERINVPYCEFSDLSLEKDYFSASSDI